MMVDNTYHAGTIRDVAAMNAASSTGYTMLNAQTGAKSNATLTVHDFLAGLAQLRDVLDNTDEDNNAISTDSVSRLCSFVMSIESNVRTVNELANSREADWLSPQVRYFPCNCTPHTIAIYTQVQSAHKHNQREPGCSDSK